MNLAEIEDKPKFYPMPRFKDVIPKNKFIPGKIEPTMKHLGVDKPSVMTGRGILKVLGTTYQVYYNPKRGVNHYMKYVAEYYPYVDYQDDVEKKSIKKILWAERHVAGLFEFYGSRLDYELKNDPASVQRKYFSAQGAEEFKRDLEDLYRKNRAFYKNQNLDPSKVAPPKDASGQKIKVGDQFARFTGSYQREISVEKVTGLSPVWWEGKMVSAIQVDGKKTAVKRTDLGLVVRTPGKKPQKGEPVDARGAAIRTGATIGIRAQFGATGSGYMRPAKVTNVKNGRVYLDGSTRPIKDPHLKTIVVSY